MIRRLVAAGTRLFSGVRRLHGVPQGSGPAIYFANHTSHLDFMVIWAALPHADRQLTSPAAAEDYWSKSATRRWIAGNLFQAVLIPRSGITRENNPLDRLAACLETGRSILIFPEGTRCEDGTVAEFKGGLFHLARRFPHLPLVPIHLENLNRLLPKGSHLPVPLIAQAHFSAPISLQPGEAKPDFLRRAREALLNPH